MDITIKYPSRNDLVQWYYQLAQKIAEGSGITPEEVNALIEAYIAEHPYPVVPADIITASNAAQNVVTSVNGEKGDVTVTGGGDVPENVVTTDNIGQNAVTSFNGTKGEVKGVSSVNGRSGAVTVSESPANVITSDNIAGNAVTSFNGHVGVINYAPPVTSVNDMTGALYTTVFREAVSNPDVWAFGALTITGKSIIFAHLVFEFEGIDITYNCTVPDELNITPIYLFSWIASEKIYGSVQGSSVNAMNKTIKIWLDHTDVVSPVQTITAGCVLYGSF